MENIEIPEKAKIVTEFFTWALVKTSKDSIHLLEVGSLLHEWCKEDKDNENKQP